MKKKIGFASACVHDPRQPQWNKPHQMPIYAASAFEFESLEQGMDIFAGRQAGHIYSRFGNPTIDAVAEKIARLESHGLPHAAAGLLCSSGMAAISTLLLALVKPGEKVLTQGNLYGGTDRLFKQVLEPLQIGILIEDLTDLEAVSRCLKKYRSIAMLYLETPANPTLECLDIAALSKLAKEHECYVVVDNTFCTPYLQQPLALGADFVVHSATKYLNGHGNSVAGVIVGKDEGFMWEIVLPQLKLLGTNCNAWDAWLLNNGLKTLELRLERHCQNAQQIAEWLAQHPRVERVNYPGLPSHPSHQLAKKQMRRFGGMLSFELQGGLEAARHFLNRLEFCRMAPTLGDIDTLALHPASMSHLNVPREQRLRYGITDGLVRLSIGIENVEDILADVKQALSGDGA
jgi:methionine-gamma-lyase